MCNAHSTQICSINAGIAKSLSISILIGLDPTTHPAVLPCTDRKDHWAASVLLGVYSSTSPLRIGCELPARGASGVGVSHVKVGNTSPPCSSTDVRLVCWTGGILRVCFIATIKICVGLIFQFRANSSTDGVELLSKKGLKGPFFCKWCVDIQRIAPFLYPVAMCAHCYALWYKSVIPLMGSVLAIYTTCFCLEAKRACG